MTKQPNPTRRRFEWQGAALAPGLAFVFITLFSQNSFLYAFNDWVDVNMIFTTGRAMKNGLVIYRDVLEQKGPLMYALHALAAWVSENSFIGIYLVELAAFSCFLYLGYRLCRLWLSAGAAALVLPWLALAATAQDAFQTGDSAEELCLPLVILGLYVMACHYREERPIGSGLLVLMGMAAGAIFWIKFTLVGFWFAWMAVLFFERVARGDWKRGILDCLAFLLGMGLTLLPWLVYFGLHGAIGDFFGVYFYNNLFNYPVLEEALVIKGHAFEGAAAKLLRMPYNLFRSAQRNPVLALFTGIGAVWTLCTRRVFRPVWQRLAVLAMLCCTLLFQYIGGRAYSYYFLLCAAFVPLGLVALAQLLQKPLASLRRWGLPVALSAVLALGCSALLSRNLADLPKAKEDYAQYQLAALAQPTGRTDDFLTYRIFDAGFYLTMHKLPPCPAFTMLNADWDRMIQRQREGLASSALNYVVTYEYIWIEEQESYLSGFHPVGQPMGEEKFVLLERDGLTA